MEKRLNLTESTGSVVASGDSTRRTARTNPDATPTLPGHRWTNPDAQKNMGGNLLVIVDAKKKG